MKKLLATVLLSMLVIVQIAAASAVMNEVDYTLATANTQGTHFAVQTLKYEPYPVNAGEWFDLWVKVQNTGPNDAVDSKFEIEMAYPFSSTDSLVRNFGIIPGTATAFKYKSSGEASMQANQIIMKFRIKAADDAPEGTSIIKLKSADSTGELITDLPIEIGKTKTSFDVVMQDSTSQGVSFAISNIGSNAATAVTISVPVQDNVKVTGTRSSIIGNLESGDYTTVSFQILPNNDVHELKLQIAYTDSAGIRNTVEKTVPVTLNTGFGQTSAATIRTQRSSDNTKYLYLAGGFVLGMLVFIAIRKLRKKKHVQV